MKLSKIFKSKMSKNTRPILREVLVKSGYLFSSDLETHIKLNYGLDMGDGVLVRDTLDIKPTKHESLDMSDFPNLDQYFDCRYFVTEVTKENLKRASLAMSKDETRIYLCCLNFDLKNQRMVSIDGFNLSMVDHQLDQVSGLENFNVPHESIKYILSQIEKNGPVRVFLNSSKDHAIFKIGSNLEVSCRLITREFPKYQTVLQKIDKMPIVVTVNRDALNFKEIKKLLNKNNSITLTVNKGFFKFSCNDSILKDEKQLGTVLNFSLNDADKIEEVIFRINASFLNTLLGEDIKDNVMYISKNDLNPITLYRDNWTRIIMPLKNNA